jgi:aryl-alcohol dehydrogenase-like predicted oxidoreductase
VEKYLNESGLRVLGALDDVAKRCNATPAQVTLAWMMARPSITAPIASATSVPQLQEIMKAADIALDRDAIAQIDRAASPA